MCRRADVDELRPNRMGWSACVYYCIYVCMHVCMIRMLCAYASHFFFVHFVRTISRRLGSASAQPRCAQRMPAQYSCVMCTACIQRIVRIIFVCTYICTSTVIGPCTCDNANCTFRITCANTLSASMWNHYFTTYSLFVQNSET